uniref:Pyrin domain-containing protein n=1 Tax=Pogona vitticeps TaxID=103695 RepID=A0ABM5EIK5_9SAUR
MAETVPDRLLSALRDLTEDELKKFKEMLLMFVLSESDPHSLQIPLNLLGGADDACSIADLLLQCYGEDRALEVTALTLKTIGCERQRLRLDAIGNLVPLEQHFIDRHREALIRRTATVDGILDMLYGIILDEEQYRAISAKRTNQEKMRELYKLVQIWDRDCRDMLYEAIKKKNKFLIEDLEGLDEQRMETKIDPEPSEECPMCSSLCSKPSPEKIWPTVVQDPKRSRKTYRLDVTEACSIRCGITDLMFDIKTAVTITYHFDSWSGYMDDIRKANLIVAGPLLNIQADPAEAVAAVHFPHILCLAGEDPYQVSIAHFTGEGMILEKPDKVENFHVVLYDPRFSLLGAICKIPFLKQKIKVHAIVLLYQQLRLPYPILHLYLLPNDSSLKQAVHDNEVKWSNRVPKPPGTTRPLKLETCYFVRTSHDVKISPEELILRYLDVDMEQQYLELCARNMEDELELNLIEKNKDASIWTSCVRREELTLDSVQEKKRENLIQCTTCSSQRSSGAMSVPVHDRLQLALDNLSKEDLERFRWKLNKFPLRQGYENIPWGRLENASILHMVDLLLDFYTEGYAPRVTVEVLEAIGCKQQAQRLRVALESEVNLQ